jgi:hypothetical protein
MKQYVHQILIADVDNVKDHLPSATESILRHFGNKYEHRVWSKEEIREQLTQHFEPEVLQAFDALRPYAYKADLARYCLMYLYGGWYIDINIEVAASPPNTANFHMLLIRDFNNDTRLAPWQVANGLFYSVPGHPALRKAIDLVIDNCKNKYYGKRTLSPTGPELFGRALAIVGLDGNKSDYLIGDFIDNEKLNRKVFVFQNKIFAIHKTNLGGDVGVQGTNNYVNMWHKKDIYNRFGTID